MGYMSIPLLVAFTMLLVSLRVEHSVSLDEIRYPSVNASDGRKPLYFSLIQSLSNDSQYVSVYSLVGLEFALDLINADENFLPGYSLHYVLTDASVSNIITSFSMVRIAVRIKIPVVYAPCKRSC